MKKLSKHLLAYRDGEIDATELLTFVTPDFRRIAKYLMKRWQAPAWFTLEDLQQELLVGVWLYVWQWDETRGISMGRYVVYNAMSVAKRKLHVARGVPLSPHPDRIPSQFEHPVSQLTPAISADKEFNAQEWIDDRLFDECSPEERVGVAEEKKIVVDALLELCESSKEHYVVTAIRDAGSLDAAGVILYDDIHMQMTLDLETEQDAHTMVRHVAKRIAKRVSQVDLAT